MNFHQFRNKKIANIGAGVEGMAMAEFLGKAGATIELRDRKSDQDLRNALTLTLSHREREKEANLVFRGGKDYLKGLDQFDIIVRSPGVPWLTPEIQAAREKGILVTSQTQIFLDLCPAHIIGVTGTKGKSTTAALVAHILRHAGKKVRLGGNMGEPIIQWLDDIATDELVVLELSSFQLQGLSVSPHIAVVLDIGLEHLDHHRGKQEYVSAKRSIVEHQKKDDIAIIDSDSLAAVEYAGATRAQMWWFSRRHFVDKGVYVKEILGEKWFEGRDDERELLIAPVHDLHLMGEHNQSNAAAASCVALVLGVQNETIGQSLATFVGLPHRMQLLGHFAKREWIDDSYATAPDATIAALQACIERPTTLIVGGSSKGYGFESLAAGILEAPPQTMVYIGTTGPAIRQEVLDLAEKLAKLPPKFVDGGPDMSSIVKAALAASKAGDTILFSPGCASFGLFKNAADRAAQLEQSLQQLKDSHASA